MIGDLRGTILNYVIFIGACVQVTERVFAYASTRYCNAVPTVSGAVGQQESLVLETGGFLHDTGRLKTM